MQEGLERRKEKRFIVLEGRKKREKRVMGGEVEGREEGTGEGEVRSQEKRKKGSEGRKKRKSERSYG